MPTNKAATTHHRHSDFIRNHCSASHIITPQTNNAFITQTSRCITHHASFRHITHHTSRIIAKRNKNNDFITHYNGLRLRNTTTTAKAALRKRFVRHLSSLGESDDEKPEADAASAVFFKHICQLVCDASDIKSSKLRCVVSVPFLADKKLICEVLECCNVGLQQLVVEKEGKTRRKQVAKERLILGVLSDDAAVCVAHGLMDLSKNNEGDGRQKKFLVVDCGASGLSLTAFALRNGLLAMLSHN